MFTRFDVFSTKGGVGKTVVSICLARELTRQSGKPVLIVDADLTGTCLGDVLESWANPSWDVRFNLAHLMTGQPELLPDWLGSSWSATVSEHLPVYEWRQAGTLTTPPKPVGPTIDPGAIGAPAVPAGILFCPSNPSSSEPAVVDLAVLHALLGHESAAAWAQSAGHAWRPLACTSLPTTSSTPRSRSSGCGTRRPSNRFTGITWRTC